MRYLYTLYLINTILDINLSSLSIVEIGGGYGGMYITIIINQPTPNYKIYDLPEVQMLQKKYISQYQYLPVFVDGMREADKHDLLISLCAWGELDKEAKEEYAEKVISKAKHFFICSNYNIEEDKLILGKYFDNINYYEDELVKNVLWA